MGRTVVDGESVMFGKMKGSIKVDPHTFSDIDMKMFDIVSMYLNRLGLNNPYKLTVYSDRHNGII